MMRTVFISFYEAFPPASGSATVTYGLAKFTRGERFLVQVSGTTSRLRTADGVDVISLAGSMKRVTKILTLRRRVRKIVRCCRDIRPDLVVLEGASWVLYHWLLLRALRAQLPGTPVVYHSHAVEVVLREDSTAVVRRITKWAEARLFRETDHATVVSSVDREQVATLYGVLPDILPNGIDLDRVLSVTEPEIDTVRRKFGLRGELVLFMGMYAYPPNREGIDFLVSSVLPKVRESRPEAKLVVLGGRVPHTRPWLINPGSIDAMYVPAVVQACSVGVAPIFSGSGTRLKILEYAAGGLPVVATRKGAEGLGFADRSEILLAEDADSFAERTVRLLSDKALARSIATAGRVHAHTHYGWRALADGLLGTFATGMGTPL